MRVFLFAILVSVLLLNFLSPSAPGQNDDPFDSDPPTQVFDPFSAKAGQDDPFGDNQASPAIRRLPERAADKPSAIDSPKQTRIWASPGEAANDVIRRKLQERLTQGGLDFDETPLEEVVDFLQAEYGVLIQIDVNALENLGLQPDGPITCRIENVTLGAALRRMLGQLELTCVPVDGYLLVTTEEEAIRILKVAVYPVGDLVLSVGFDALIDVIISTVAAETWGENGGGEAEIRPMVTGSLVVSQAESVHDQIVALLEALRRVPREALINPGDLPKPPPAQTSGGRGGGGGGWGWGGGGGGGGGGQF